MCKEMEHLGQIANEMLETLEVFVCPVGEWMREFQARKRHVQRHETRTVQGVSGETSSILVLFLKYEGWKGRK